MLTWWQIILILVTMGSIKMLSRALFFKGVPSLLRGTIASVKKSIKEGEKENGETII